MGGYLGFTCQGVNIPGMEIEFTSIVEFGNG